MPVLSAGAINKWIKEAGQGDDGDSHMAMCTQVAGSRTVRESILIAEGGAGAGWF